MDPIVAELIKKGVEFIGLIAVLATALGAVFIWTRARRREESGDADLAQRLDEMMARMSRLESAVDASAIEIERISEGQRFTTRLLAERSPDGQPNRALPR